MKKEWNGKRYHTLNYFLRQKFGEKIIKISLDGGFTCPNRDGTVSKGGCIFCSSKGSGDFTMENENLSLQFDEAKKMMRKKWKKGKYIGYFQAHTNTYAPVEVLREKYETILAKEDVIGLSIATRPDCLPEDVLDLLEDLNKRTYLWVELGLQTINEDTAKLINRGYPLKVYEEAIKNLKRRGIETVTHCILGLPQETKKDMLDTIDFVAATKTQGIKLHLLHLMRDTAMVKLYDRGELQLLKKVEYIDLVVDSIERLPEDMVIHRITGDGPRDTLIGPKWSLNKWEVLNAIDDRLVERNTWQGKYFIGR